MAPNKLMKMTVDLDFFNNYLENKIDSAMCKILKKPFSGQHKQESCKHSLKTG